MTETTTTRPDIAEVTQRAGDARHRPLPPGQRVVDWFPRFGTDLGKPAPKSPDRPGRRDRRRGDRNVRRARRRTRDAPSPTARCRLPLRLGLDRNRPPLGGRGVRRVLPPAHRADTAPRRRRHPRRVPRPRRLPIGHHDRGRAQRRRAPRRSPRRRTARQRPRRTTQARQPGAVRLHRARNTSVASTCTPRHRPAAPDRSCSTCCSTPTPERGSGRKSATGRCPAAWSGRSTKPSHWSCCAAADSGSRST